MAGKAAMSVSGSSEGGEDVGNPEDTINSTIIQQIITQIQRSYTRNRKVRIKLLNQINVYFFKISEMLEKDTSVQGLVMEHIEDLQSVILETTRLCICLSDPATKIQDVYGTFYDMGSYLETIIIGIYTWCLSNGKLLGNVMKKFLNALVQVSCENPDTWLYYVMISPLVLHILNTMFEDDHTDFRSQWAQKSTELMKQMTKAVSQCGDFGCQHYLLTVLHGWTQWIHAGKALPMINSIFSCVDPAARKELFMAEEPTQRIRSFLNSFNLSPRGPRSVIPILCNYVFVGEYKLNSEAEFWVDFSVGSGRLHTFYSIPGAPFLDLSIRKDQIHSICLNWVVNAGDLTSQEEMGTQLETQTTVSAFMKDEKVLFFHIVLNTDFEDISRDIESLIGKKCRSVYFVFRNGELIEKIMKEMNYSQHACGSMKCQRPRLLRRMLVSENKLSYTQSWCPDSQVFGLDKSPLNGSTRSYLNRTNTDLDSTFTRVQRFYSPRRSVSPGTRFTLDVSSAENTQTQSQDMAEVESVPSNTVKNLQFAANLVETPGAFYLSVASSDDLMSNEEVNTPKTTSTANETFYEDPLPRNDRRKFAHLGKHVPFQQLSPLQKNLQDRILSSTQPSNLLKRQKKRCADVDNVNVEGKENLSQRQLKLLRVRSSSPKPNACLKNRSPPTPGISEICSPPHNIFNNTIMDFEQDSSYGEVNQENNLTVTQKTETTLKKSIEDEDQDSDPSVIHETKTPLDSYSIGEKNSSRNTTRSPALTLSPIVGYSKPVLERLESGIPSSQSSMKERSLFADSPNSTLSPVAGNPNIFLPQNAKKNPCYAHAYNVRLESLQEKSRNHDKLNDTQSWCPDSHVFGLDKPPLYDQDQDSDPSVIHETETPLDSSIEEEKSSRNTSPALTLSPIVGYSKPLLERLESGIPSSQSSMEERGLFSDSPNSTLSPVAGHPKSLPRHSELSSGHTSTQSYKSTKMFRPQIAKKNPCYAHAYKLRLASLQKKRRNPAYDPYDLMSCSDDSSLI